MDCLVTLGGTTVDGDCPYLARLRRTPCRPALSTPEAVGRARLEVPVAQGDRRNLSLLVVLRHGEHSRTRTIEVERRPSERLELRIADRFVVPGSQIPVWVTAADARSGKPLAGTA